MLCYQKLDNLYILKLSEKNSWQKKYFGYMQVFKFDLKNYNSIFVLKYIHKCIQIVTRFPKSR